MKDTPLAIVADIRDFLEQETKAAVTFGVAFERKRILGLLEAERCDADEDVDDCYGTNGEHCLLVARLISRIESGK